ncbi:hypothetical protein JOQ06_011953, partial [Pogonophryne albipinna]
MQRGDSPPDSESVGEFDHAQSVPSLKHLDSLELHLSQHPFRMEMFTMWPPQVTSAYSDDTTRGDRQPCGGSVRIERTVCCRVSDCSLFEEGLREKITAEKMPHKDGREPLWLYTPVDMHHRMCGRGFVLAVKRSTGPCLWQVQSPSKANHILVNTEPLSDTHSMFRRACVMRDAA